MRLSWAVHGNIRGIRGRGVGFVHLTCLYSFWLLSGPQINKVESFTGPPCGQKAHEDLPIGALTYSPSMKASPAKTNSVPLRVSPKAKQRQ